MASAILARQQLTRVAGSASSTTASNRVLAIVQRRGYATPNGPPPANFRTSRKVEWHWDKDTTLDRLGKYFLMTEMARGMYVLLEQFFRPPYVFTIPTEPPIL
jgi:NADH dehydrogenase (ubiquinone) Fe-S protein 8